MNATKTLIALFTVLGAATVFAATGDAEAAESIHLKLFAGPFHIVFLHLPIGIVALVILLEMWAIIRPSREFRQAIGISLWVAFLSAVVATLMGLALAENGGYDEHNLIWHERTGIAVSVVTGLIALFHSIIFRGEKARAAGVAGYRLMLLADMALIALTGHFGGNLTHGSTYLTEHGPVWFQKAMGEYEDETVEQPAAGTGESFYARVIVPIFEKKCYSCHGEEKQKGEYRMDTAEGLFKAGDSELEPIAKGNAMTSYLVETILLPEDDDLAMPPEGKDRLTPEETMQIIQWIYDGAEM